MYTEQTYYLFCEKLAEYEQMFEFANEQIYDKFAGKPMPTTLINLVLNNNIQSFLDNYKIAMATTNHLLTTDNIEKDIWQKLRAKSFRVYSQACRIYICSTNKIRIPDVVVSDFPKEKRNKQHDLENPILVAEVLSPSTSQIDLTNKVIEYQSIPELQDYLIVYQSEAKVLQYSRHENIWLKTEYLGLNEIINLDFLEISLPLSVIYQDVEFE